MNFLKKLFKKKEEEIALSKLSSWLVQNTEFTLANEVNDFKESLTQLESALDKLSDFSIMKLDIPHKAKNQIQGNKKNYLQAMKTFHDKTEPPSEFNFKALKLFDETLTERLKKLNEKTQKNYYILKSVVGKELENVLINLRKVDSARKKIKSSVEKQGLESVEAIHMHIKEIDDTLLCNKDSKEKLQTLKKEQTKFLEEEKQITDKIESLKSSEEAKEFSKLKQEQDQILNNIQTLQQGVVNHILPLENVLRKLRKPDIKKSVQNFLAEKADYILKDKEKVKTILSSLEKSISNETISSKNKDKSLSQIKDLIKSMENFPSKFKELEDSLTEVKTNLSQNQLEEKMREEMETLSNVSTEISRINESLDSLEEKEITKDILEIQKHLKKLGHPIIIKDDTLGK